MNAPYNPQKLTPASLRARRTIYLILAVICVVLAIGYLAQSTRNRRTAYTVGLQVSCKFTQPMSLEQPGLDDHDRQLRRAGNATRALQREQILAFLAPHLGGHAECPPSMDLPLPPPTTVGP
jgi:hypothetical protein